MYVCLTLIEWGSWLLLESRGGWISPHHPDHPKTLQNPKFFPNVHNELGKVTKFGTSRPHFSWRNSHLEKVQAQSTPPPLGLRKIYSKWSLHLFVFLTDYGFHSEKNSLNLEREYYQDFSCEFELQYYPFDTQVEIQQKF